MDVTVEDRSRGAAHIGATVGIEVHRGKAGASGKSPVADIGHRTRDSKCGEVAPAREGIVVTVLGMDTADTWQLGMEKA